MKQCSCLYLQAHYGVGGSFDTLNALQRWEAAGVLPVNRVSEIFMLGYNYTVHVMKFPLELNHRQSTEVEYQIKKIHRPSCGCLASMFSIALCEGGDLGNKVVGENMAKCSFEVCPSPTVKIHTVV